jgi:hypothetical protein
MSPTIRSIKTKPVCLVDDALYIFTDPPVGLGCFLSASRPLPQYSLLINPSDSSNFFTLSFNHKICSFKMQRLFVSAALVAFIATASAAPTNQIATRVGTVATKASAGELVQRAAASSSGAASSGAAYVPPLSQANEMRLANT